MGLARHESEFEAAGEASLGVRELLDALRRPVAANLVNRSEAIANCLSGQDGWRDAAARLGGAFAPIASETGLTDGKE
ncbi:hypothetical protein [Sphingomonas sp.]|uniref:hypothetical protein n=1 Tax=Sphingomonas sp. TaxID=28214 RepID=UPI00286ABE90|nr:hypothetical protein [Sphingomonas sp.]